MTTTNAMPSVGGRINGGAFGVLYNDPRDLAQCIKVLKKPITGDAARSLHRLVDIVHWARPSDREHLLHRFAWPVEVFGTGDQVDGYAMPLAPQSCFFDLRVATKTTRTPLQLKFLMDTDYWAGSAVRSAAPSVSFQDRVEIALDCIDSIQILHENDLCYGDISSNNVVARLDPHRPGVFFFDADSIMTAEQRAAEPIATPDWDTPAHIDPWAIDRSRVALLVFRLLVMRPRARPEGNELALLPIHEGGQLSGILAQTYVSGGNEAFESLASQLRVLRDETRSRRAMAQAVQSGYARVVLRERPASLGVDDLHIVEQARRQLELEQRLDQAQGRELRNLMRKARYSGIPFTLDTRQLDERPPAPSTPEQLHDLIADVRFAEISNHVAAAALGPLERDSWLPRAIQHAHIELDEVALNTAVRPGSGDLSFSWPSQDFVNIAEIGMNGTGIVQVEVVERVPTGSRALVSISAPSGTSGVATLRLGTRGTAGLTVMSPRSTEVELVIPALPDPPAPVHARYQATKSANAAVMFDPVKAAAAEASRLRARRRHRQRNASLMCTLVLLCAGVGWWFLRDRPVSPPRQPLTVVVGSVTYELQVAGDQVSIEWTGLPSDVARLEVRESSDGENWVVRPSSIDPRSGATLVPISAAAGEPLLLRLQPYDTRGLRPVYRAQASWLDGSGLQSQPNADTSDPRWTDISWLPATEGAVPLSYEVRTSEGTGPWTVEPVSGTRFIRPEPSTGRVFFAVRSVFADGTRGPWIETSTLPESPPATP